MKNQLLDKFKNSLLTNEQKAVIIGGVRPCINLSVPSGCKCSRSGTCETVTCSDGSGSVPCASGAANS